MDIIFKGMHTTEGLSENIVNVLNLFKERYQIVAFNNVHLSVTLMNSAGEEVELMDSDTAETYRFFEIYRYEKNLIKSKRASPKLKLVIDNTH